MRNPLPPLCSLAAALLMLASCGSDPGTPDLQPEIEPGDLERHITFLASDSLRGRETGTAGSARAATWIADRFRDFGLEPAGNASADSWYQEFTVNMSVLNNPHSPDTADFGDEQRLARNVAGMVRGSRRPGEYIVIGAHYDHLGMGRFGSLYDRTDPQIHNGADDNASGTAGVLELAHWFSEHPPERSILFLAFSGEEMGLLGSRHFVENPTVPLDSVMAMINMDMIGRLQDDRLMIFGTGTSDGWEELLLAAAEGDSLQIDTVPDGTGASDHTSFYNRQIPVLHYFTDTHADYHRPSDDPQFINYKGQDRVLEHLRRLVSAMDTLQRSRLAYTEAPVTRSRDMALEGPTMGVTPDYGFEGEGMRITGVRSGGPADRAGLQNGDVIVRLNGQQVGDIYAYMEALNTLQEGAEAQVTVVREGEERTFTLRF